jgi:hypothetical protein
VPPSPALTRKYLRSGWNFPTRLCNAAQTCSFDPVRLESVQQETSALSLFGQVASAQDVSRHRGYVESSRGNCNGRCLDAEYWTSTGLQAGLVNDDHISEELSECSPTWSEAAYSKAAPSVPGAPVIPPPEASTLRRIGHRTCSRKRRRREPRPPSTPLSQNQFACFECTDAGRAPLFSFAHHSAWASRQCAMSARRYWTRVCSDLIFIVCFANSAVGGRRVYDTPDTSH